MITKEEAMALEWRAELVSVNGYSFRGKQKLPRVCRVNGKCKTWKTRPDEWQLPVVFGLRGYFYIGPHNAAEWSVKTTP